MQLFAQVTNNEITRINIMLPAFFGSSWVTAAGAADHGLFPITGSEPAYDPATHRLSGPTYAFTGEAVERVYVVEAIPAEEIAARVMQEITDAAQRRLDDWAKTRNYDGILSLCTYATSSVPKFAAEGQRGVDNRDQTWAALYEIMADVESGLRPIPSGYQDIEADLPELNWP
jgi:hypothetical protein